MFLKIINEINRMLKFDLKRELFDMLIIRKLMQSNFKFFIASTDSWISNFINSKECKSCNRSRFIDKANYKAIIITLTNSREKFRLHIALSIDRKLIFCNNITKTVYWHNGIFINRLLRQLICDQQYLKIMLIKLERKRKVIS